MKSINSSSALGRFVFFIKQIKDAIVLVVLFGLYHLYDILCYGVSNMFTLVSALCIMLATLFLASILLIFLHQTIGEKYEWDVLGLAELNALKNEDIPKWKYWKRFLRWIMRRRWTIYWVGSIIVGPPVVALLLRKNNKWLPMVNQYVIPGTFVSVFFWVFIWKGTGLLTWEQFVKPFFGL